MISNYLKIAIRNLLQNKTFSLINILGLAFGLCCALLIALWVHDEYSVDKFHKNNDRLFWVISELKSSEGSRFWRNSPGPLAQAAQENVSGIEAVSRFTQGRNILFKKEEGNLEERGIAVDSVFLDMFDFPLAQGDALTALDGLNNIIVSQELANKLFPNEASIVGKIITIDDWGEEVEMKITGVLEPIPTQSTFQFEFLIPFRFYLRHRPWDMSWGNFNNRTALLLEEGQSPRDIEQQARELMLERNPESTVEYYLYPYKDVYLKSDFSNGLDAEGRIVYVRIFIIIGLVILLIACINFMNLSTARAGKRAKEVGVRKATGADRSSLIRQFLGESVMIALISGLLAVTMADVLMIAFNSLTGKEIVMPYAQPLFWLIILAVCVLTGLMAGIYPALYLSGFNPSRVLKGEVSSGKSLSGLRRILVIAQFALSITFVVTTIIAYNQLQFILTKDLGLDKDNILYHDLNSIMGESEEYRSELLKIPEVKDMTAANFSPLEIHNSTGNVVWSGKPEDASIFFHVIQSDHHLIDVFNIELLEGKGFPEEQDTTLIKVILNEEAVNTMMLNNPVGARITVWGDDAEVVGVVKNFHHQSLDKGMEPVVIYHNTRPAWRSYISIEGDVTKAIQSIKKVYDTRETNYPFDYGFVDESFEATYKNVSTMGQLSNVFAIVAIFVSCLGLFGLASYMTEQRKKETGIRKALGANVLSLVLMFTKNFLFLIIISFAISAPLAWYFASEWLSNFSFRIEVGIIPFIIGGVSAVVIAVATVSYHTVKVARANPIDSLKYE